MAAGILILILVTIGGFLLSHRPAENTGSTETKLTLSQRSGLAIDYLSNSQQQNGSFMMDFCTTTDQCETVDSPFITSFVADSLSELSDGEVEQISKALISYLASTREDALGTSAWRFWPENSNNHLLLPPDIDVTACVGASLRKASFDFPANLDNLSKLLTPQGFKTYIITQKSDEKLIRSNDVDCVVNANALFYYTLFGEQPTTLCDTLNATLQSKTLNDCSIYYSDNLSLLYAASRAYAAGADCLEPSVVELREHILAARLPDGTWGNDLLNALAANALLNIGHESAELDSIITTIQNTQQDDGSWDAEIFFADPVSSAGFKSKALTTALSAQALARYDSIAN